MELCVSLKVYMSRGDAMRDWVAQQEYAIVGVETIVGVVVVQSMLKFGADPPRGCDDAWL